MGKGDKKSKRGKIWTGSYGVRRKRKSTVIHVSAKKDKALGEVKKVAATVNEEMPVLEASAEATKKKAAPKKKAEVSAEEEAPKKTTARKKKTEEEKPE
jgi:30S ribosomal protein S31